MGNSILFNTAGSIALAINYVIQGPYTTKFLTKQAAKTIRINAEVFIRVTDAIFCIDAANVDLSEADLDVGSSFAISTTYYIYGCHPVSGIIPLFKISLAPNYPSGWDASNSRKIGGFTTDGSGNIDESTLWDLRTVDVTHTGVTNSMIPADEISYSKLDNTILGDNQVLGKLPGGSLKGLAQYELALLIAAVENDFEIITY